MSSTGAADTADQRCSPVRFEWNLTTALAATHGGDGVRVVALAAVADHDWVRVTQAQFGPTEVVPGFWIVPTWSEVPTSARQVIRLDPGRAFRPHQIVRLRQFGPRPVVIGCALQGSGGGVTQRLHLQVGHRQGADLLHQWPMLPHDPGKAIGKLRIVDRLLVQNFEEPGDSRDREAAVAGDDLVQPDKQYCAISGRGRCGELHQPRDLLGRQAAEDGGRAVVHAAVVHAAPGSERTVGLHAVAEPLRQGRRCGNRIRNQQDEKRTSQAHASLRSLVLPLWRATASLLSKTSPVL